MPTPQSEFKILQYYLNQIHNAAGGWTCVYRGQADAVWEAQDGATHRLRTAIGNSPDQQTKIEYHTKLLSDARQKGFGIRDGRLLSDLELLSSLQHFEAATCLLDFSHNPLVALFMACRDMDDKDASIIIVPEHNIPSITTDEVSIKITNLIQSNSIRRWNPVLAGPAERRMMAQSGVFLINYSYDAKNHREVTIQKKHKKKILKALSSHYQINAGTLFMDLAGFAKNNSHSSAFQSADIHFYRGNKEYNNGNYQSAIDEYDEAIRLNPELAVAYAGRGGAQWALGEHAKAHEDMDSAYTLAQQQNDQIIIRLIEEWRDNNPRPSPDGA